MQATPVSRGVRAARGHCECSADRSSEANGVCCCPCRPPAEFSPHLPRDSGHRSFSSNNTLNDFVGGIVHSSILVPYHGWRVRCAHLLQGHTMKPSPSQPEGPGWQLSRGCS